MLLSINQPAYLPWLGYFERIHLSDIHVVLDHVQYEKNSMTNRNKVRTKQGWAWMTVPVKTKGSFGDLAINKLQVSNESSWTKKHFNTICGNYSKSKYFSQYIDFFEDVFNREWSHLNPLLKEITQYILRELNIQTKIIYSSELDFNENKNELLLKICEEFKATTYLSGPFGRDYLDTEIFTNAGVKLEYHDYEHPIYTQAYNGFESYMSIIDLLFNHGNNSLEILSNNGANAHAE